jgi:hypothetical protein
MNWQYQNKNTINIAIIKHNPVLLQQTESIQEMDMTDTLSKLNFITTSSQPQLLLVSLLSENPIH